IVQCHGGPGLEPLLEHGAVEVVTDDEEAPEGGRAEGAGLADGGRKGRPVQVGEDRAGARVDAEALALLTGVLEGEEERLADRASGPLEGGEEVEVLLGQGPFGDSGPIAGDRATFVEIGRHQVHHLVERGCEGDLIRCDGGVAVVGRLEDPGVAYDLGRRRRRLRAEPHQQLLVAGQRTGEPGDGGRHPLIAGDHGLHGAVLGSQEVFEHRRSAVASHSLASSHTGAVAGVGEPLPHPYNPCMHYDLTVLPNGLRVITEEMPSLRSVAVGCWVDTGTRDELPSEAGASHFLEHLLFKGSETMSARDIAETFDSLGAESNAFTSKDYTCFWARLLDQDLPTGLGVLAEMIQRPAFRDRDIDAERSVVVEEINMNE